MTTTATGARLEHPIGADGLFTLRMRDGDVRLRAVDGDTLRIRDRHEHDLAAMFEIELGDGSASLEAGRDSDLLRGHRHGNQPDIEVDLPRRATIVIETASAEVEVDGMLGDQRYRTVSGDLVLRDVSGRIAIEAVSGDVDVIAIEAADVTIKTVSGDVGLRAATLDAMRVATTSGDVKVSGRLSGAGPFGIETVSGDALLAPVGDVRVEMATMSGDLHSEIEGKVEGARGQRSLTIGTGGTLVNFRSLSGDLNVVRPSSVVKPAELRVAALVVEAAPRSDIVPVLPAVTNGAIASAYDDARLRILRSLEQGEIDVAEAGRRFEALDGGATSDPGSDTTRIPIVEGSDA